MAIDRIGKGGGPRLPEAKETGAAARPSEAQRPFEVRAAQKPNATHAGVEVAPTTPLARLHAGEIDVHRYVDLKVDEATAHLASLRGADLDSLKSMLRDQIATDPALADLVKQAASGAAGSTPNDAKDAPDAKDANEANDD